MAARLRKGRGERPIDRRSDWPSAVWPSVRPSGCIRTRLPRMYRRRTTAWIRSDGLHYPSRPASPHTGMGLKRIDSQHRVCGRVTSCMVITHNTLGPKGVSYCLAHIPCHAHDVRGGNGIVQTQCGLARHGTMWSMNGRPPMETLRELIPGNPYRGCQLSREWAVPRLWGAWSKKRRCAPPMLLLYKQSWPRVLLRRAGAVRRGIPA